MHLKKEERVRGREGIRKKERKEGREAKERNNLDYNETEIY